MCNQSKPYQIKSYTLNRRFQQVPIDNATSCRSDIPPLVHGAVGYPNSNAACEAGAGGCLGHGVCTGGPGCIGIERISVPVSLLRPMERTVGKTAES